ncbi:unnamed protein product, partial [Ectocarpus fasciculatus]
GEGARDSFRCVFFSRKFLFLTRPRPTTAAAAVSLSPTWDEHNGRLCDLPTAVGYRPTRTVSLWWTMVYRPYLVFFGTACRPNSSQLRSLVLSPSTSCLCAERVRICRN